MVEQTRLPKTGTCLYSVAPGGRFCLGSLSPRPRRRRCRPRQRAWRGGVACDTERALASDLAPFGRGPQLGGPLTAAALAAQPRAHRLVRKCTGKKGRGRTLVRRVRGEPFCEARCAGSADFGGPLPLQT